MSKETGGPAFPEVRVRSGDNYNPPTKIYYPGMTLRDHFAAKAMQGMLAENGGGALHNNDLAQFAYAIADAMLAERNKEQP